MQTADLISEPLISYIDIYVDSATVGTAFKCQPNEQLVCGQNNKREQPQLKDSEAEAVHFFAERELSPKEIANKDTLETYLMTLASGMLSSQCQS